MTLILTFVDPQFVVQVSDRRTGYFDSRGRYSVRDDTTNKAVLLCDRMIFSFTGVADLQGEPASVWMARRLADDGDLGARMVQVQDELTGIFARRPYRGYPLALVGGGYFRDEGEYVGVRILITNMWPEDGSIASEFRYFLDRFDDRWHIYSDPNWLSRQTMLRLARNIRRVTTRAPHIQNVVRLLVATVSAEARRNDVVGSDLMVSVLAKPTGPPSQINVENGQFSPGNPGFWYISSRGEQTQFAPVFACQGGVLTGIYGTVGAGWTWGFGVSAEPDAGLGSKSP